MIMEIARKIEAAQQLASSHETVAIYMQRETFDNLQRDLYLKNRTDLHEQSTINRADVFIVSSKCHPEYRIVTFNDQALDIH